MHKNRSFREIHEFVFVQSLIFNFGGKSCSTQHPCGNTNTKTQTEYTTSLKGSLTDKKKLSY